MSVEVSNLTKIFGEQKAVNNIYFKVEKGEIVGFLGPNGAGKSTTMKMITGYLSPSSGNIQVCGMEVSAQPKDIKKKIGYLPESNPLYFDMYVREYLDFISDLHKVPRKKARIEEVIKITGLSPESTKKIGQLSKGYKQRVGLAAALIHDPEVLILDEPTSGLDPNQIVEIRELIKNFGKERTVIFSSHILQEVEAVCDRVIIINKGNLVADDSVKNLQKGTKANHAVVVQFKEDVKVELLKSMRDVKWVEEMANNNSGNIFGFKIFTADAESVRKQLLELVLQNNLNIVSLQSENQSLEEVFRNLTGKSENP